MKVFEPLPAEIESVAKQTVDASIKVHRAWPGVAGVRLRDVPRSRVSGNAASRLRLKS